MDARLATSQARRARLRGGVPVVALVGYTNAGKSTLFNALVKARAYAADQLFATLDTTTRQLFLQDTEGAGTGGRSVSLSDTVGFIRDLPHGLIDAFQATLQEAADADLLLHVVDAANPHHPEQVAEVQRVLHEIGAGEHMDVKVRHLLVGVGAVDGEDPQRDQGEGGACHRNADPNEKAHDMERMKGEGCGAVFTAVSSNYTDFAGLYDRIREMRPDLPFTGGFSL